MTQWFNGRASYSRNGALDIHQILLAQSNFDDDRCVGAQERDIDIQPVSILENKKLFCDAGRRVDSIREVPERYHVPADFKPHAPLRPRYESVGSTTTRIDQPGRKDPR